jgi:hypothetical protein
MDEIGKPRLSALPADFSPQAIRLVHVYAGMAKTDASGGIEPAACRLPPRAVTCPPAATGIA